MADTTTANYEFVKPEVGASSNTWGTKLNDNWDDLDTLLDSIETDIAAKLAKSGGTMTGFITLHANPSSALHAATKQYVDSADNLLAPKANPTFTGKLLADGAATPVSVPGISGGVLDLNCNLSNVFRITMDEDVDTLTLSNISDGQSIIVRFIQDTGGGFTMNWPSVFKWPGGVEPSLSTASGDIDELYVTAYDIGGNFQYNATLAKDFS